MCVYNKVRPSIILLLPVLKGNLELLRLDSMETFVTWIGVPKGQRWDSRPAVRAFNPNLRPSRLACIRGRRTCKVEEGMSPQHSSRVRAATESKMSAPSPWLDEKPHWTHHHHQVMGDQMPDNMHIPVDSASTWGYWEVWIVKEPGTSCLLQADISTWFFFHTS